MENRPVKKGPDELEILRKVLFKTISRWYFVLLSVGISNGGCISDNSVYYTRIYSIC
jgi:hypothetical protein